MWLHQKYSNGGGSYGSGLTASTAAGPIHRDVDVAFCNDNTYTGCSCNNKVKQTTAFEATGPESNASHRSMRISPSKLSK